MSLDKDRVAGATICQLPTPVFRLGRELWRPMCAQARRQVVRDCRVDRLLIKPLSKSKAMPKLTICLLSEELAVRHGANGASDGASS
jgi:hypothetical protein